MLRRAVDSEPDSDQGVAQPESFGRCADGCPDRRDDDVRRPA
jgi:hypothetical protein